MMKCDDLLPTLEHVLSTFAYHVQCLAGDRPAPTSPQPHAVLVGLGLGGYGGAPLAYVKDIVITPVRDWVGEDPWGGWAQVTFDGRWVGNRHGAVREYTRLCAPVIAWVMEQHAARRTGHRPSGLTSEASAQRSPSHEALLIRHTRIGRASRGVEPREETIMGSESKKANGAMGRTDLFLYMPEDLTVVTDKAHPLYDERIYLPLDENLVKNIMVWGPREPVEARKNGKDKNDKPIIEVIDGRQRHRATAEANRRLLAQGGTPWPLKVILSNDVKDDGDLLGLQILHNELRTDDPPSVKAQKCVRLLAKGKKIAEAANIFGCTEQTIHFWKKLMSCSPTILKAVDSGELPQVVAVKLADLPREDQDAQYEKMKAAGNLKGKAAVEEAAAAADIAKGKTPKPKKAATPKDEDDEGEDAGPRMRRRPKLEELLARFAKVKVEDLPNGRIVLRYVLGEDCLPKAWLEDEAAE